MPLTPLDRLPPALRHAAGWTLEEVVAKLGRLELSWRPVGGGDGVTLFVARSADGGASYRTAGAFAISYKPPAKLDPALEALLAACARELLADPDGALALLA